jgi:hypothetical protein
VEPLLLTLIDSVKAFWGAVLVGWFACAVCGVYARQVQVPNADVRVFGVWWFLFVQLLTGHWGRLREEPALTMREINERLEKSNDQLRKGW